MMATMRYVCMLAVAPAILFAGAARADDRAAVEQVLDQLHERAAQADFEGYFALYHDDAVFLGTDRDEYWPLAEFKAYTQARFATGVGWTYHPVERFVHVAGDAAWFEEQLRHASYGLTRGTGVFLRTAAGWRIAQYHLTLPIPNELFPDFAEQIEAYYSQQPDAQQPDAEQP